jgi:hypothetical protein
MPVTVRNRSAVIPQERCWQTKSKIQTISETLKGGARMITQLELWLLCNWEKGQYLKGGTTSKKVSVFDVHSAKSNLLAVH